MSVKKSHYYAVILAGGAGTRFWPMSRREKPKQFLSVAGSESLLVQTIKRIRSLVNTENILIVTNKMYKVQIQKQVHFLKISSKNILLEPEARNTAPAIGWAAARIYKENPNGIMMVLPSDHLILNSKGYSQALRAAINVAANDVLVTFGIKPTRPETGYGYIKTNLSKLNGRKVLKVDEFKEKPSLSAAKKYVKSKAFFWNSGMFIWKASAIMDSYQKYLPHIYHNLKGNTGSKNIQKIWSQLTKISIDYGILEKAANVYCVPAQNIGWTDLGSWESLAEILLKDKSGNAIDSSSLAIDCRQTMIQTQGRTVVAVGLENVIIVETPDAVLVCSRDQSQKVKKVMDVLKLTKKWKHLT